MTNTALAQTRDSLQLDIDTLVEHIYPIIPLRGMNTTMLGIGSIQLYDTYLSPLYYTGTSISLLDERMRRTTWFNTNFYKQQLIGLELAKANSPAQNVREYSALLSYQLGGHYMFWKNEELRLGLGGSWNVVGGILYNERNGNNPASARLYSNLNMSAIASYRLPSFALRWQIDSPMVGLLFSPRYGQSYYELSLGNTVGIVNFASLHNQRVLRNQLTIDIPMHTYSIRLGYVGSYYQTKVQGIQTHNYTHSFLIGFPIETLKKQRQKQTNSYWENEESINKPTY